MSSLVSLIKKIVIECLKNENLSDVVYGTYTGSGLKIDSKPIAVPLSMVDVPERLKSYKTKVSVTLDKAQCEQMVLITKNGGEKLELEELKLIDVPCTVTYDQLKAGDRVAVVQKRGSQKYIITDKT